MLSVITNAILDVGFGVAYWITKKTINGIWIEYKLFCGQNNLKNVH